MKVKEDLLLPSEVTKVKTFIDLYASNKIDKYSMAKLYQSNKGDDVETQLSGKPKRLCKKLMSQGLDRDTAAAYSVFSMALYRDDNLKKNFLNL